MLTFGSLFAGIGGFDLGFERAGMRQAFACEINRNCNAVRRRHWPQEETHTDVATLSLRSTDRRPDVLCGGFPCQDLSVAGRRAGLDGKRSGLWWEFARVIGEFAPEWVCIENVPGLLSSNGGRDMGAVLWTLGQLGYGFAYRVLDSQWFGVPQRRRRVFIVGRAGGRMRSAADVLFERDCLPWDSPPRREARADVARCLVRGSVGSGYRYDANGEDFVVTHTLTGEGHDASEDGTGRGVPLVPMLSNTLHASDGGPSPHTTLVPMPFDPNQITSRHNRSVPQPGVPAYTLHAGDKGAQCIAFSCKNDGRDAGGLSPTLRGMSHDGSHANGGGQVAIVAGFKRGQGAAARSDGFQVEQAPTLTSGDSGTQQSPGVMIGSYVRRMTPRECERLQGFPDDWTRWRADGTKVSDSRRYQMCGNAVTVNVAEWIARRIVEAQG